MSTVYLGLGSNLGDRRQMLVHALLGLRAAGVSVERVSSVYQTAPVGLRDQPEFLNIVVRVGTALDPEALLALCLAVEAELGRVRRERWGPRTIDIDVLWYEGISMQTPALTLPHPRMIERSFVLIPLAEIAPELVLEGHPAQARAAALENAGVKRVEPLALAAEGIA